MAPLTPLRRFLRNVEIDHGRPIYSLRKRNRQDTGASLPSNLHVPTVNPIVHGNNEKETSETSGAGYPSAVISSSLQLFSTDRASVALQQEDDPFDAVVISTLPCYPFCCHEDLIMMSRQRLIEVAQTFNMHLPQAMKIEVSETITNAHIRHAIEVLVGIVPNTPAAPKPSRSWPKKRREEQPPALHESESDGQACILSSPPSSPLAKRVSRRRGFSLIGTPTRILERLDEEDEGSHSSGNRPLKKRKMSNNKATTTRFLYEPITVDMDISPVHPLGASSGCHALVYPDKVGSDSDYTYSSPVNLNRTTLATSSGTFLSYLAVRGSDTATSHGNPDYFQSKVGVEHMTRMDIA